MCSEWRISLSIASIVLLTMALPGPTAADNVFDEFLKECKEVSENSAGNCLALKEFNILNATGVSESCKSAMDSPPCNILITKYHEKEKHFEFKMVAPEDKTKNKQYYFAIGFSTDKNMGDDLVVYCGTSKTSPEIGFAWNDDNYNAERLKDTEVVTKMIKPNVKVENSILHCSFTLPGEINSGGGRSLINLSKKYNLQLARGEYETDFIHFQQHYSVSQVDNFDFMSSKNKITQSQEKAISNNTLRMIHIIGMVSAFSFFMPVGVFIARYYKETWAKKFKCKRRYWALFHISYMICALVFVIVGLLVWLIANVNVLLVTKGPVYTHKAIGWTAVAIVFYLCTTHWIRPSNLGLKRLADFVHGLLGISTFLIGNIVILMSTDWTKEKVPVCDTKRIMSIVNIVIFIISNLLMASYIAWTDSHLDIKGFRSFLLPVKIVSQEEAPRPKLRKRLLIGFIILTGLTSAITMYVFIKIDPSTCKWESQNTTK